MTINEPIELSGTQMSKDQSALLLKLEKLQDEIKIEANVEVKVENSRGEHYQFSFADLKKVTETIKPFLRKNGLVIWQVLEGLGVRTTLVDKESGQWISALAEIPSYEQKNIQYYGSVFTYLRRYSLTTMLGLVNDADDDANQVDNNKTDRKVDGKPSLTFEVMSRMIQEVDKGNWKDVEKQMNKYHLSDTQKTSLTTVINQKKSSSALNKLNA
jgi:hypothetical protein